MPRSRSMKNKMRGKWKSSADVIKAASPSSVGGSRGTPGGSQAELATRMKQSALAGARPAPKPPADRSKAIAGQAQSYARQKAMAGQAAKVSAAMTDKRPVRKANVGSAIGAAGGLAGAMGKIPGARISGSAGISDPFVKKQISNKVKKVGGAFAKFGKRMVAKKK